MPSTPTVSRCALSSSERPPPVPRATPTTLGRPSTGSSIVTSSPAARSQPATKPAIAASPAPPGTRSGLTESISTSRLKSSTCGGTRGLTEAVDRGQLPVEPGIVEPVADHEPVRDHEACEVDGDVLLTARGAIEEGRQLDAGRAVRAQLADDHVDRPSRVDDVLDQQQVAAGERAVDHVRELDLATVAGGAHELQLGRDAEAAKEIGGEDGGALQDHDQDQRLVEVGVPGADLAAQLLDAAGDLAGGDHRLPGALDGCAVRDGRQGGRGHRRVHQDLGHAFASQFTSGGSGPTVAAGARGP